MTLKADFIKTNGKVYSIYTVYLVANRAHNGSIPHENKSLS